MIYLFAFISFFCCLESLSLREYVYVRNKYTILKEYTIFKVVCLLKELSLYKQVYYFARAYVGSKHILSTHTHILSILNVKVMLNIIFYDCYYPVGYYLCTRF